jgi:peptidoglycan/xylan/chitin deacetylase (PgdA/CDA1 family)
MTKEWPDISPKEEERTRGTGYHNWMAPRTHDRYPYSAISGRRVYDWPGGKRLAIYVGLNLEWFSFGEGLGAELAPGGPQPDVLNYAWRDYGNRVGVFRLADLFAELKLPASLLVNAEMYRHAPDAIAAFPGAEIIGHGRSNSERQGDLTEYKERSLIEETAAAIEKHSGRRPRGWLGPWISQSPLTPDLLQEAGYHYMLDWCHDDQPVWMKTRGGRILSLPYPQELNDIPQIVARKREGFEFADMIVDAFEVMHEECTKRPLVMGIALHAYVVGWPHRFKHLSRALRHIIHRADERVWFTTAGEIADHAEQLPAGTVP